MCDVCNEIYYSEREKEYYLDINTYHWDDYYDDYDYVSIPINFCYECGKRYGKSGKDD